MKSSRTWPESKNRRFRSLLLHWFEQHKRQLPWRDDPTPYRVWVSEVMLQQTQVRTVIPYYDAFLKRFPEVTALAGATEREVLRYWAGLGYYSRARNLRRAARMIVRDHGGSVPRNLEEILLLPGIGRYTAGAIQSIAFNEARPVVDGNVRRVISRLHCLEEGTAERFFWEQAASWVPADRPSDFNQAVMELGALVCLAVQPLCESCPVRSLCEARGRGLQSRVPVRHVARAPEDVALAALVLESGPRVLLTTAGQLDFIPGKWALPLRVIGTGETPEEAARVLVTGMCGSYTRLRKCPPIRHCITHHRIRAHVFHARADSPLAVNPGRWLEKLTAEKELTSSLFKKVLRSAFPKD